jgi:UTP--glucose-1-phosphate uridylyltransferase
MPITDAVIPVAGLGTRLLPATRSQPKEMLPIVDRPVVQYVLEEAVAAGIARVLFVTGRRKRAIEDHFDADPELGSEPLIDPRTGLQILYTRQASPAGLGDALRYGGTLAQDQGVAVALGDTIIESRRPRGILRRLIDAYEQRGTVAAIAVERVTDADVPRYGIVEGDERDGLIEATRVFEKPSATATASRFAVASRYVLGPAVFEALRSTRAGVGGEVQVADALTELIERGERVVAVPLEPGERRHDIGTVASYCSAFLRYALTDPRFGAELRAEAAELLATERG